VDLRAGVASYAVTMTILPGETACLACIFPDSPRGIVETCDTSGILNSAVNFVASVAATEALKLAVGARDKLRRTLLSYDVWSNDYASVLTAKPRPGCRACQEHDYVHLADRSSTHLALRAATRCRFTSASGLSTSPRFTRRSRRTARSSTPSSS